jgi:serine/threonine protein phosphatase PrpC
VVRVQYAGRSERGPRSLNQDYYLSDPALGLFAVADGMGGHNAGEVASKLAVETLVDFIRATAKESGQTWPFPYDPTLSVGANRLAAGMRLANRKVYDSGMEDPQLAGMGTTIVAALMAGDRIVIGHVGDSRAYLMRGDRLVAMTQDHTWVAAVLAAEPHARTVDHPMRHVLTNGIGMREDVVPALTEETIEPGDTWLLCSDGVHGYLPDEALADALRLPGPDAAASRCVEAALEQGGTDNATAIVARFV